VCAESIQEPVKTSRIPGSANCSFGHVVSEFLRAAAAGRFQFIYRTTARLAAKDEFRPFQPNAGRIIGIKMAIPFPAAVA
jgi:hypothetical protein